MTDEQVQKHPPIRVSFETYEMLKYLKRARRGSFDDVIQDMLSEFAPNIFNNILDEHDPGVEIQDFGTPKYLAWRENFLRSGAKQVYSDFKKRELRKIEDGDFFGSHPRMHTYIRSGGEKDIKFVF